jgi:tetratricopeptide (TPR) repeat protein
VEGLTLPKRFRPIRRLGEGGMGVVYEAFDEERSTHVALKTVRHLDAESLARFKREFRALADIHHRNVVTLGELVSEGDQWFFTMELVAGGDFLDYVRPAAPSVDRARTMMNGENAASEPALPLASTFASRRSNGGFDELRLRSALRQVVEAVDTLHAAGLVHRDIKPSNIRVAPDGRVVLLDFGLVTQVSGQSQGRAVAAGTPEYMAPEQAASSAVGPEADWYAVGVLLFEAMTGRLPFEGAPLEIMMRKQTHNAPAPRDLAPDAPEDLATLSAKLLAFDPKSRPRAAVVLQSLGAKPRASLMPSNPSRTETAPFVGRARELDALQAAFRSAREGRATTMLVQGESGVGKSCLVRRFVDGIVAAEPDVVVLAGRCYERESVPYKAFDDVVDALTRFLVHSPGTLAAHVAPARPGPLTQVFPVLRRVPSIAEATREAVPAIDPFELRRRAFAALREMLTRLATRRPLVVMIDDLQWADTESFALLADVLRPPEAPPLLLLATVRTPALQATEGGGVRLRDLMKQLETIPGDVRGIEVGRLPATEARELATRVMHVVARRDAEGSDPSADDASLDAIVDESEGHPFFIDALVRYSALPDRPAVARLEDALWARIAGLDPTAREVMDLLAVAAAPLEHEIVASAVGGDRAELSRRIALLRVAHLVTMSGVRGADTIEPYHDRVRAAVLAKLDADARARCHRALVDALERAGSRDAEALARHWRGAGDKAHAARYAAIAADEAASAFAFDRAAKLYEEAIELGAGLTPDDRAPTSEKRSLLHEKLGDALANAGRGPPAAAAYAKAVQGSHAARALELRRRAAEQLLRNGHFDDGIAATRAVLAAVDMSFPARAWMAVIVLLATRLLLRLRGLGFVPRDPTQIAADQLTRVDVCWSVMVGMSLTDHVYGAMFQTRHLLLALRTGEPGRVARALAVEGSHVATEGGRSWRRVERVLARAEELSQRVQTPYAIGWTWVSSGVARFLVGRFAEARHLCDVALATLRDKCAGAHWESDVATQFGIFALAYLGEMKEVSRRVPLALAEAKARGDLYASTALRVADSGCNAWVLSGDPDACRADVEEAMARWSNRGFHIEHYWELNTLTMCDLFAGRAEDAYARIVSRWGALVRSQLLRVQFVRVVGRRSRATAAIAAAESAASRRDELLADARRTAAQIAREQMAWATPIAMMLRAGANAARGGAVADATVGLLREAVRGFEAAEMALFTATARRTLGKVIGGDEGHTLVREADAWMQSQGIANASATARMLAPGFGRFD